VRCATSSTESRISFNRVSISEIQIIVEYGTSTWMVQNCVCSLCPTFSAMAVSDPIWRATIRFGQNCAQRRHSPVEIPPAKYLSPVHRARLFFPNTPSKKVFHFGATLEKANLLCNTTLIFEIVRANLRSAKPGQSESFYAAIMSTSSSSSAAARAVYRQYSSNSNSASENLPPRTLARVAREVRDLHKNPPEGVRLVVDSDTGVPSNLSELMVRPKIALKRSIAKALRSVPSW
jgi:hypothetical protein